MRRGAALKEVPIGLPAEGDNGGPPLVDPEELERLRGMNLKAMLVEARLAAVRQLLLKVNANEASAAEIAVLRNLLRDNGMILGLDGLGDGGLMEDDTSPRMGFALPQLTDDYDEE
jgi:hypothetical protein